MNTLTVKSSFYNDLKRVSSKVDEWPEWKRNSLKSSSNESKENQCYNDNKNKSSMIQSKP